MNKRQEKKLVMKMSKYGFPLILNHLNGKYETEYVKADVWICFFKKTNADAAASFGKAKQEKRKNRKLRKFLTAFPTYEQFKLNRTRNSIFGKIKNGEK